VRLGLLGPADGDIAGLARGLRGQIRSYPERVGGNDDRLRSILAERPGVTADDILREEPFAFNLDRRGLQRALRRLRRDGVITPQ